MRTLVVFLVMLLATPVLCSSVIVAALLGVRDEPGSIFDHVPRIWGRLLVWAGGVRVMLHNAERMANGSAQVYVANHLSWFDVFTMASVLKHYKFVAKAELDSIPLFGAAIRAAGFIFVDRTNHKAAFAGYEAAAERMRNGFSVIVFPEGTRGKSYALRPFKKGPFVLAVAAGVPIVPTLVYGTREVQRKGSVIVRGGVVHVHFLEPVSTAGMTYTDRSRLAQITWERMAAELEAVYGIPSTLEPPSPAALEAASV